MLKLEPRKKNNEISGIYKIINLENEEFYIGSAVNFKRRTSGHLSALRKNKHHSPKLQNAYNKYGESKFKFVLLVICPREYLIKLEQKFLDNLKPFYNICPNAANCLGKKDRLETKLKKSLNHSKRGKFGKDNPSSKKIYQYDISGNFLKIWYGSEEICRENSSYDPGNLRTSIRRGLVSYGYLWYNEYLGVKIEINKKRRKLLKNSQIIQKSLNGDFIKLFKNIKEAGNELKKCPSSIRRCVQGKQKTAYGFLWEKSQ